MSDAGNVPNNCGTGGGFLGALDCGSGVAANKSGQTADTLLASIAFSVASFGVQILIFMVLRLRLARIYRPRSYLVAEKERVPAPPNGLISWLKPLFSTPNLAFIQKCGLDAYFFLRYLRLLLKIFLPLGIIILPILLPINQYSGSSEGLVQLSISNVSKEHSSRLWAHLILALVVILWVCYVFYTELRGYIRVRQAFLTSPQHRIKASATTVLVTSIPSKWLTVEALSGLYNIFPGGIRNIWINRNYDELAAKVEERDSVAQKLEKAETNLIKACHNKHAKSEEQRRKADGKSKRTRQEMEHDAAEADAAAQAMAQGDGTSAGGQHDHPQGIQGALHEAEEAEERRRSYDIEGQKRRKRFGVLGEGVGAIGGGLNVIGKGVNKIGRDLAQDVDVGFQKAAQDADKRIAGNGFVVDDDLYRFSGIDTQDMAPTPPPKSPRWETEARLHGYGSNGAPAADRNAALDPYAVTDTGATINTRTNDQGRSNNSVTASPSSAQPAGPQSESRSTAPLQRDDADADSKPHKIWQFWRDPDRSADLPSPRPHTAEEEDGYPFGADAARDSNKQGSQVMSNSKLVEKLAFWRKKAGAENEEYYPPAFDKSWDEDQDGEPYWRRYLEPEERETMRLPVLSQDWCPTLPLVGQKVDKIYWLRRELARLNLEIEMDQADTERFPLMNSAFIQFNHQVAAHMACQSVSHHLPQHMSPRLVEISPDDVIWDNLSVSWWERYLRSGVVLIACIAMIVFYAIPVTFTSLLSKLSTFEQWKPFAFLATWPNVVINIIQGVLPPLLLSIILSLVPIIFGLLVKQQGVSTGTARELGIQQWYFIFLFIQVFLVVTITGGLVSFITAFAKNPSGVVGTLANNLPQASTYFFSYLLIQALSNSAGSILQVGVLVSWFLLAPVLDSTARAKWRRQTSLQNFTWGSFFPPFTNFAVIGLVYSVIAPLILVFMVIIFAVFWIVYRYNVLYVYQFHNDTGGLLFPVAVNQLFAGLYTMELCLIGFFLLARNPGGNVACLPQAAIMIVALVLTVLYQWALNGAFQPLFRYLPITLEDEAVIRDEEFARAQASKFGRNEQQDHSDDMPDEVADRERDDQDAEAYAIDRGMTHIDERRPSRYSSNRQGLSPTMSSMDRIRSPQIRQQDRLSVNRDTWHNDRWRNVSSTNSTIDVTKLQHLINPHHRRSVAPDHEKTASPATHHAQSRDAEAQHVVGDVLFSGFADELEDLTPEERDLLVRYAFQHSALRAKRPVVWIPRDKLGVSDDEIRRTKKMSTVKSEQGEKGAGVEKTNVWMSNEGTALDGKGKVVFRRSPPDFSNVDLIAL